MPRKQLRSDRKGTNKKKQLPNFSLVFFRFPSVYRGFRGKVFLAQVAAWGCMWGVYVCSVSVYVCNVRPVCAPCTCSRLLAIVCSLACVRVCAYVCVYVYAARVGAGVIVNTLSQRISAAQFICCFNQTELSC